MKIYVKITIYIPSSYRKRIWIITFKNHLDVTLAFSIWTFSSLISVSFSVYAAVCIRASFFESKCWICGLFSEVLVLPFKSGKCFTGCGIREDLKWCFICSEEQTLMWQLVSVLFWKNSDGWLALEFACVLLDLSLLALDEIVWGLLLALVGGADGELSIFNDNCLSNILALSGDTADFKLKKEGETSSEKYFYCKLSLKKE